MPHHSKKVRHHSSQEDEHMNMDDKRSMEHASAHTRRHAPYGGAKAASHGSKAAHHKQADLRDAIHQAPHPVSKSGPMISGGGAKAASHGQAPGATSMRESLGIIDNVRAGKDHNMGIPGIISSTSLGPDQRQRLVSGIIESPMSGGADSEDAVSTVMGHDATAYNQGMIHLRGSHFK
jgi:hypothetical protein